MDGFRLTLLTALIATSLASPSPEEDKDKWLAKERDLESRNKMLWEGYKMKYGKKYKDANTEHQRMLSFLKNLEMVKRHNELYEKGEVAFEMEINHRADMPFELIAEQSSSRPELKKSVDRHRIIFSPQGDDDLPEHVDWRHLGFVTEVKNQGDCNSSWAFSATGALEGQFMRKSGKLISLSEQSVIDCDYSDLGCRGGFTTNVFLYLMMGDGIATESLYPYEGKDGPCRYKSKGTSYKVTGFAEVPVGEEDGLKEAVAIKGPISVQIDARWMSFHLYKKGIYYEENCSTDHNDLIHSALVVGYGSEGGEDYWIVKNSFGKNWGEDGYIRMARNRGNNCGIATRGSYPTVYSCFPAF